MDVKNRKEKLNQNALNDYFAHEHTDACTHKNHMTIGRPTVYSVPGSVVLVAA